MLDGCMGLGHWDWLPGGPPGFLENSNGEWLPGAYTEPYQVAFCENSDWKPLSYTFDRVLNTPRTASPDILLWILQSFSEQLPNRAPVQGLRTTSFTALWSFLLGNSRNSCNSSRNSTLAGIYLFRVNNEIIRITYQWNYE